MAFDISGTSGNDTIFTPANQGDGTVRGLAGDDRIEVPVPCPDFGAAVRRRRQRLDPDPRNSGCYDRRWDSSLDGNDSLVVDGGNAGSGFILGNGGSDTIFVLSAFATVVGGFGNDTVLVNNADQSSFIFLNEGNDTLDMSGGNRHRLRRAGKRQHPPPGGGR